MYKLKPSKPFDNNYKRLTQIDKKLEKRILKVFNIRQEDGLVRIVYPVVILKATRPAEPGH